ncbi:MAG TPA: hypothetical protein VFA04_18215 [Bryobacteraceae bacterium]|nr:hypothetical protein [Bryobacteraceae bacterium]
MTTVAGYAAKFDSAAGWVAQENMTQRGFEAPKRHGLRAAFSDNTEKREMISRDLTGLYGFTSDPAIHEVRAVTAVDGRPRGAERALFESAIREGNERARRTLLEEFDRASINVSATDFGPLVLLFTKGRQEDYEFTPAGTALIGADKVLLVRYRQKGGPASLHLKEGSRRASAVLTGQIEVRESDFAPLRITLRSERKDVRDEADVDYLPQSTGLLLPVSIIYRRYVKNELVAENRSRISGWRRLDAAGAGR